MPLVRVLLGWMATWMLFLVWEAVEGKVAGGAREPGRGLLRRAPGAYFIEALLFTLVAVSGMRERIQSLPVSAAL